MKTHFKSSVDEVRYFQRHPGLQTLDGSIAIPDNLEPKLYNPMFVLKFKDGNYYSKNGEKVSFASDKILEFEYYIKAEQFCGSKQLDVSVTNISELLNELRGEVITLRNSIDQHHGMSDGPREYASQETEVDNEGYD